MTENKNKIAIIALVVVFVLPVILAKVALENDWFNKGATNQGELLTPPVDLSKGFSELPPLWRLVYVLPEECDAKCTNAIYALGQIHIALGKHMDRVEPLIITTETSQLSALDVTLDTSQKSNNTPLDRMKQIKTLNLTKENVNEMFKNVPSDGIFIVDTLNNGMLKHELYSNKEEAVQASRSILSDIKKLLKLSRIG
jgi:hypothetical protein